MGQILGNTRYILFFSEINQVLKRRRAVFLLQLYTEKNLWVIPVKLLKFLLRYFNFELIFSLLNNLKKMVFNLLIKTYGNDTFFKIYYLLLEHFGNLPTKWSKHKHLETIVAWFITLKNKQNHALYCTDFTDLVVVFRCLQKRSEHYIT